MNNKGNVFLLLVLLIICAGGGYYYWDSKMKEKATKEKNLSDCRKNMEEIFKAVEAHNADCTKTGARPMRKELSIPTLLKFKYLKAAPACPENGVYKIEGFMGQSDGRIACTVHGTSDPPSAPK